MITDSLFRTKDLEIRKKFNSLVQSAKYKNVETHIFSSLHSSGEKLNSLTGIAAILKYSMPLEDEDEDENDIIEENFRTKIADRRVNL